MVKEVKIKVVGHRMIPFGELTNATGSANTPKLRLYFNSEWDGMSKTAKFTDARGNDAETTDIVDMTLQEDYSYLLEVPASVLQYEGDAQLTIVGTVVDGTSATTRITTIPLAFSVQDSGSWRVAWNNEQPEATVAEQVLSIVHDAEAYARGTVDGVDVPSGSTGYRDNAKYYKEQAEKYKDATARDAAVAEAYAIGTDDGEPVPERAEDNAKYYKEQASASADAAEGAAVTAGNQAAAALGYRNEAQTFASSASGFAATAEAGKSAAETAQGLAETAQSKAEAAQSKAETAQSNAEAAQNAAAESRVIALDSATAAYNAQLSAEDAQTAAENAQTAAETAQGKAEDAQTAAAASASDALASSQTAQAWAEGKRGDADVPSTDPAYHNNAKYWSEQAAQTLSSKYEKPANGIPTADIADGAITAAKLSSDAKERIYAAYATETQSNVASVVTDIGAENVPLKSLVVDVAAIQSGSGTPSADNVRPITGRTSLNVVVSPTVDPTDGTIYTVSLSGVAGGVYIGRLDVATGVLTIYAKKYTLNNSEYEKKFQNANLTYTGDGYIYMVYVSGTDSYSALRGTREWTRAYMMSNMFKYKFSTNQNAFVAWEYGYAVGQNQNYFILPKEDQYSTVEKANTWLSTHPIDVVLALATPQVVQLSPTDVMSILGQMNVTCESSNIIQATYRLDPTLAYDKLKAAIVAAGTT